MAAPTSPESYLVAALKEYLEAECLPYADSGLQGAIAWDYLGDDLTPQDNPRGAVLLPGFGDVQQTLYQSHFIHDWRINLRFFICRSTLTTAQTESANWRALIKDLMLTLSRDGYSYSGMSGLFQGIQLIDGPDPEIERNQDDGVAIAFRLRYRWNDDGVLN